MVAIAAEIVRKKDYFQKKFGYHVILYDTSTRVSKLDFLLQSWKTNVEWYTSALGVAYRPNTLSTYGATRGDANDDYTPGPTTFVQLA